MEKKVLKTFSLAQNEVYLDLIKAKQIKDELPFEVDLISIARLIQTQKSIHQKRNFIEEFKTAFVCRKDVPSALELIAMKLGD